MPKERKGGKDIPRDGRKALRECLRKAFPIGEGGSFQNLLKAINEESRKKRRG